MRCQKCGAEVAENAHFCRECGAEIDFVTDTFVTENKCPKCGNALKEGALFCNNCGHKISDGDEEYYIICPKCGKQLKPNAQFCGKCGTLISDQRSSTVQQNGQKKDKGVVLLVVILIAVVIACASAISVVYFKNYSVEIDNPVIEDVGVRQEREEDDENIAENESESNANIDENVTTDIDTEENVSDYLFPSDQVYITENDLMGLSKDDIALIRNEIYARHGYIFQSEPYKSYFAEKEWYVPNANFNESMFNIVEKSNKDFIVAYEEKMGWR